ncbi:hypothetical protein EDD16DRAFT_1550892 [Pisolithus croceorrhizus]|nr:hypothetical protein EV401DRAFT_2069187 [Pisolithus croceorrhizus]KAI6127912.1 hypothetical protein EDD16DRAFT_1550892 [Pisolithus croceorrhizus]KAI6150023.1 hypothetical protein EDD17DRAFT_1640179 [Pisolithus thermaeus]
MQSIFVTLQEVVSKEVVVLSSSHSEPNGHAEGRMSSRQDETVDVEVLVDLASRAYRRHVVEKGEIKVVLLRPNGVVGAIVRGVAGLERYFEGSVLAMVQN